MNHAGSTLWLMAALAWFTVLLGVPHTSLADTEPLFQFPQTTLSVRTAKGRVVHIRAWVADTPRRQEQGLMFVRDLDEHAGMIFVYPGSRQISMWMKNTYIPLDMLFLDAQGRIDYIVERTTPLSLDIIAAPRPVTAVIELKGGAAQRLGIRTGDALVPESSAGTP